MLDKQSILIISVFGRVREISNDRVNNLYDFLPFNTKKIITTDFSHLNKAKRTGNDIRNVEYISVPEYSSNLSLKRLFSHWVFAFRLLIYLKGLKNRPDIIYCVIPTPSSALIAGTYSKLYKIKFIIDIVDIWPDGLFPINSFFRRISFLLMPWNILNYLNYNLADKIITTHSIFTKRIERIKESNSLKHFYLGINNQIKIEAPREVKFIKEENEIWITYGGSIANIYDFDLMIGAVEFAQKNQHRKVVFVLVGGGVLFNQIFQKVQNSQIKNYVFTDTLNYNDFLYYLTKSDIAFNIFKENDLIAMSYKIYDYFSVKSFVINNLKSDSAFLIDKYSVGFNVNKNTINHKLLEAVKGIDLFNSQKDRLYSDLLLELDRENIVKSIYQFIK